MEIVIATTNAGKFREISAFLKKELPFVKLLSLGDFGYYPVVAEDGNSIEENALKKAKNYGDFFNLPVIAEDSALEVEALNNAPGIFSSRYGENDRERIERLLKELKDISLEKRYAQFRCAAYFYLPDGRQFHTTGEAKGYITEDAAGKWGFGYDPIFYSTELNKRFSEVSPEEKLSVSHRGKALRELVKFVKLYALEERLKKIDRIAVSFSGGEDSLFLLATTKKVAKEVVALFVDNTFFTEEQQLAVNMLAKRLSVELEFFKMDKEDIEKISENSSKRCYYCKRAMFKLLSDWCRKKGYTLLEGTNASDLLEDRPGLAAVKEFGLQSPLLDVMMKKEEVRSLLSMILPDLAEYSYSNTCLLTRFPVDYVPDRRMLKLVELSEGYLTLIGLKTVRIRIHPDGLCRIEVGKEEIESMLDINLLEEIKEELKNMGCRFVVLDLDGYSG